MSNHHPNLLIIGQVWPEPESTAAGKRMLQLIKILRDRYQVIFACAAQRSDHSVQLSGVTEIEIVLNCSSLDSALKEIQPEIVIFDRFMAEEQYGWRVASVCPCAVRILNTEDLHCLRKSRQDAITKNHEHELSDILNDDLALRELASIYRCDLSLMVSEFEMELLSDVFKIDASLLFYMPIFAQVASDVEFESRSGFMFIGNYHHKPNYDAVIYLKQSIWSKIRSKLNTEIYIYGAYMPDSILKLHEPAQGFIVRGRASNAQQVIQQARVMLAPIRFGAGIKGKLLEAMAYGTPSVTTSIGAEGISTDDQWNGFVEDNPLKFADAAVLLYKDKSVWKSCQKTGYDIVSDRFSESIFRKSFYSVLETLLENRVKHRQNNFIGRMLQHHMMRSTEFMSRWIELKNEKLKTDKK